MTRTAVILAIFSLAILPVLVIPFLGLERAAWSAAISATLLAPLIALHTALREDRGTGSAHQANTRASTHTENQGAPASEPGELPQKNREERADPPRQSEAGRHIQPLITTTLFGVVVGFAALMINATHGGWYAAAFGMSLMFGSGVLYEKWTAAARKDMQHTLRAHIATNAILFGLIVAPSISGGADELATSLDGTSAENLGTLISAIAMGAIPAAILFRLGTLTTGGYEARHRTSDSQRDEQREEDWARIRSHIGPAVFMALITLAGSWLMAATFGRPEYGLTIGFVMALVMISVDISIRSADFRT